MNDFTGARIQSGKNATIRSRLTIAEPADVVTGIQLKQRRPFL
jgi:hypothetical protein